AVLLSHDQHPDNLDRGGRAYVETDAPLVLSTASAADRIGSAVTALPNWTSYLFDRPEGGVAKVTGVPALHGPEGSEPLVGEEAAEAARILDARHVVPLHFEGWGHFTQGADTLRKAFDAAGLGDRLALIEPGGSFAV